MSIAEVKGCLDKIKKRDEELTFRGNKTEEYVNQFSALDAKKAAELEGKLEGLKIPRLKELHIKKLVDTMPKTAKEAAVRKSLTDQDDRMAGRRRAVAAANTWETRVEQVSALIQSHLHDQ